MAANYRMLYLAAMQAAGDEADSARSLIWLKLFGPQPPKAPPRASDFVREP